jgi:signal transduction histidine kinase/ligand-binding sensor domain-containing protein
MERKSLSIILLILVCNSIYTQELKFEHLTIEQGLSQNSVKCIYQDSKGYIWFGTEDGLNRYDGYTFTVFRPKLDDTTSISDNIINSIFEDSQGNLWVSTFTGNLNKFNRETGKFKQYLIDKKVIIENYNINPIAHMYEDKEHTLWAFGNCVFYYEPARDMFRQIDLKLNTPGTSISLMYEDSDHLFWIGTSKGLYKYNMKNETYRCFKPSPNDSVWNAIFTISEDKGGIFWVGTNHGLYKFDKNSEKFLTNYQITNVPKGIIIHTDIPSVLNDNRFVWMSWQNWNNNTIGVSKLNKATNQLTVYTFDDKKLASPSDNVAINMSVDKAGVIWVGTFLRGIFNFEKNRKFITEMNGNSIDAFLEDRNGYLWISTSKNGLYRYNKRDSSLINISNRDQNTPINTFFEDSKGLIWFGTYEGLYCMSNSKDIKKRATCIMPGKVKSIAEDHQHRLWLGCEGSLIAYYPETKKSITFQNDPENLNSISHNSVESILIDKTTDEIWVATWDGLNRLILPNKQELTKDNVKFITLKHIANDTNTLSDNKVISLCLDRKGILWAGTFGGGINRIEFNRSEKKEPVEYKIKVFSKNHGLPNDVVYGILEDNQNNLWISTNDGLSMFNPEKEIFSNFDVSDGLQSNQFFWRSYYQSPEGKMYFGGVNGYNTFYPDSVKFNQYQPPVQITAFSIFNKLQIPGAKNSPLKKQIDVTDEIKINYNQSVISFDYVALNYIASIKNNYAFKMEGFDKDWQYVGTQRKATYTNLDPGTYIFRVKASNNDGIWNDEGTSLRLIIVPPFWMTWWFRIIMLMLFSLILLIIYSLRVKAIHEHNRILERTVEQRTKELKHKNDLLEEQSYVLSETNVLLEERQQQVEEQSEELMAQKEELVHVNIELNELNATKDKFFSIIAHDIKNPFNSILGFTELLQMNFNIWTDEKKLQIVDVLYSSSRNVFELLENLLQWSLSQRGVIEFNPEKTQLRDQVNYVLNLLKDSADEKEINLIFSVPVEDIYVFTDIRMVHTILRNLIGNAIKFTKIGGVVEVKVQMEEKNALIKVIDNGLGIPKDIMDKIFRIESHHSTEGTNSEKGTGLGLILAKEFVGKLGGEIWAESEEGRGSTFSFTLPLNTKA